MIKGKRSNENLHKAKVAKNDEFYTQLSDIEKELEHYTEHFKGKVVYCNCDDARESNFFKYFSTNFQKLGLKKLIASGLKIDCIKDGTGVVAIQKGNDIDIYDGNGDFRSEECIEFLKEADIVVTNPPFSLFREYVAQLMQYGKKFIVIGNGNAVTYKEIFPYIKDNKMWIGASKGISGKAMEFVVPNSYEGNNLFEENGVRYGKVNNTIWFTNLEHNKRNEELILYKHYNPTEYPKYQNADAIEVSKVAEIPMDYEGVMGVPISFLDKYCPNQFRIVKFRKGDDGKDLSVNGKCPYFRILIQKIK